MNKADVICVHALRDERSRALRELRAAEKIRDAKHMLAASVASDGLASPAAAIALLEYHDARCAVAYKNGQARGIEIALSALGDQFAPNLEQLGLNDVGEDIQIDDAADREDSAAVEVGDIPVSTDIAEHEREAALDSAA